MDKGINSTQTLLPVLRQSADPSRAITSDDPVPLLEPRRSLIAPCLVPGAYEAIVAYAEFSLQRCQ